jgi:hypothetical protein
LDKEHHDGWQRQQPPQRILGREKHEVRYERWRNRESEFRLDP